MCACECVNLCVDVFVYFDRALANAFHDKTDGFQWMLEKNHDSLHT